MTCFQPTQYSKVMGHRACGQMGSGAGFPVAGQLCPLLVLMQHVAMWRSPCDKELKVAPSSSPLDSRNGGPQSSSPKGTEQSLNESGGGPSPAELSNESAAPGHTMKAASGQTLKPRTRPARRESCLPETGRLSVCVVLSSSVCGSLLCSQKESTPPLDCTTHDVEPDH